MDERLSDAEREQAVAWLCDDLPAGRLSRDPGPDDRSDWGEDIERTRSPQITGRAICLFGTVDVWRVPADMPGDYGEVTRGLQARHRELPPWVRHFNDRHLIVGRRVPPFHPDHAERVI